jgi:hypothetical protein
MTMVTPNNWFAMSAPSSMSSPTVVHSPLTQSQVTSEPQSVLKVVNQEVQVGIRKVFQLLFRDEP